MSARILIVEDNAANLELMTYLLGAYGHTTLTAMDGEQGLEMASIDLPDLIICDLQMPNVNGYEVAQRVKRHPGLRGIPLLAVTAFAMVGDRDKALAAGFDGYLAKPIDPETFVQEVEGFLRCELRCETHASGEPTTDAPSKLHAKGRTILVVDNLQVNLELASALLEYSGYTVTTAQNSKDALDLARRAPPDLILSDVCMPDGSGYDLIREVKSDGRLRSIPFIFLTATATSVRDRQHGLELGAVKFLFRPLESQALLSEIESCLAQEDER